MESEIIMWLLGVLVIVLSWIGGRVHIKLDELQKIVSEKLSNVNETLNKIDKDLRKDISHIESRISKIEAVIKMLHPEMGQRHDDII